MKGWEYHGRVGIPWQGGKTMMGWEDHDGMGRP